MPTMKTIKSIRRVTLVSAAVGAALATQAALAVPAQADDPCAEVGVKVDTSVGAEVDEKFVIVDSCGKVLKDLTDGLDIG